MTSSTRLTWPQRLFARLAMTPLGTWLIRQVATRIDPPLLRATRGRLSFGGLVGIQVGLLTTVGAKTGKPRTVPLLVFEDAGRIIVIGSNIGAKVHAGWAINLRANPRARLSIGGREQAVTAAEVDSPERERLWAAAERIYPGYRQYEQRAGSRHIPVFALTPDPIP